MNYQKLYLMYVFAFFSYEKVNDRPFYNIFRLIDAQEPASYGCLFWAEAEAQDTVGSLQVYFEKEVLGGCFFDDPEFDDIFLAVVLGLDYDDI